MDSPSPPKRRRPDEARDEDLYLEDGNVVLSVNDLEGNVIHFRVHKSVLARQSSVFKDMFSVPSPASVDMYDGAPLVRLHDDSKEIKRFLQALYDPE
jgi:BTB/POZ domain